MLAINRIDFSKEPFVQAPHGNGHAYYCGGHYANRDQMPVFVFPEGLPAVGDPIRFFVHREDRRSKNQFRTDGKGQVPAPGSQAYGDRTIIRVKPLPNPPATLPNLIYIPRAKGHSGGKNGGNWDVAVEGARKVYQWRTRCSGGKWWEWFTLALVDPGTEITLHRTGAYANGSKVIDETRVLQVA